MSGPSPDAIVVGAGIVGAACSLGLAREGLRVLILDAGFAASGATAAGMGHLVVMDDSEPQFALTAHSLELWREIADELPAACEDEPSGTLWVAEDGEEMAHVEVKASFYRERGVEAEVLDAKELRKAEPRLSHHLLGALRVPGDRVLYPPAATRWFLERARELGGTLREGVVVREIGSHGVVAGGESLSAEVVVNAAGPRAAKLSAGLPIEPRKGHLLITDRYPGFCRHQVVELGYLKSAHTLTAESVAFNVQPRATGQLLLGSSRELVGWDRSLNRSLMARMVERALHFLPELRGLSVLRSWVGFRPATPSKLPLIGRWPAGEGPWIAAGHEGLGITMATGTAGLLADLVQGRRPALDPAPFAPAVES